MSNNDDRIISGDLAEVFEDITLAYAEAQAGPDCFGRKLQLRLERACCNAPDGHDALLTWLVTQMGVPLNVVIPRITRGVEEASAVKREQQRIAEGLPHCTPGDVRAGMLQEQELELQLTS